MTVTEYFDSLIVQNPIKNGSFAYFVAFHIGVNDKVAMRLVGLTDIDKVELLGKIYAVKRIYGKRIDLKKFLRYTSNSKTVLNTQSGLLIEMFPLVSQREEVRWIRKH